MQKLKCFHGQDAAKRESHQVETLRPDVIRELGYSVRLCNGSRLRSP